jgi:acyl-coenzyme A synthetase/AMP-(fatty) acid ligase
MTYYTSIPEAILRDSPSPAIIIPDHQPHSSQHPPRPVKIFYSHLRQLVEKLAAFKGIRNLKHGDRVSLLMPTSLEFVSTLLALASVGASSNPLNPSLKLEDLSDQIAKASPKAIIYSKALPSDQIATIKKYGTALLNYIGTLKTFTPLHSSADNANANQHSASQ